MSARPTFIIVAAQKSGTIWLRENLDKHPDIHMGRVATHFFNRNWRKGTDWYFEHFDPQHGEKHIGEHCPSYTLSSGKKNVTPEVVVRRIDETLPDVRLVALLRNPVDRAYSAFIHHMTHKRIKPDAALLDHLDEFRITEAGRYADALAPFKAHFGDRLHVALNEEIKTDANRLYRRVLRHIGADRSFRPDDLTAVVHTHDPPAESPYAREGGGKRPLTDEERGELTRRYAEEVERLEELLGRDLGVWKPA